MSGTYGAANATDCFTTPTFDSAPSIIASGVNPHQFPIDDTTVIFVRKGTSGVPLNFLARQNSNTRWQWGNSDMFGVTGGSDSAPAAVYNSSVPSRGGPIVVCVHGAASPGYMFCADVTIQYAGSDGEFALTLDVPGGVQQIGFGTFNSFVNPALVAYQDQSGNWINQLFGKGTDSQYWYASRINGGGWFGWNQLPTRSGGFLGDPAVSVLSGGRLIVCGLASSGNLKFLCNHQASNGTWSGWTTAWDLGSPFAAADRKAALATASNATFLFSTAPADPSGPERMVFSTDDGVSWSAPSGVGAGNTFKSGPGAFARSNGSMVMSAALGGDKAVWYSTESSAGFDAGWFQIQAHYQTIGTCR